MLEADRPQTSHKLGPSGYSGVSGVEVAGECVVSPSILERGSDRLSRDWDSRNSFMKAQRLDISVTDFRKQRTVDLISMGEQVLYFPGCNHRSSASSSLHVRLIRTIRSVLLMNRLSID